LVLDEAVAEQQFWGVAGGGELDRPAELDDEFIRRAGARWQEATR
jgi:hypothetical protein